MLLNYQKKATLRLLLPHRYSSAFNQKSNKTNFNSTGQNFNDLKFDVNRSAGPTFHPKVQNSYVALIRSQYLNNIVILSSISSRI